jgi:hypothetical protein
VQDLVSTQLFPAINANQGKHFYPLADKKSERSLAIFSSQSSSHPRRAVSYIDTRDVARVMAAIVLADTATYAGKVGGGAAPCHLAQPLSAPHAVSCARACALSLSQALDLCGREALSQQDVAAAISRATGSKVTYEPIPIDVYIAGMKKCGALRSGVARRAQAHGDSHSLPPPPSPSAGVPEVMVRMVEDLFTDVCSENAIYATTNDIVKQITGRDAITVRRLSALSRPLSAHSARRSSSSTSRTTSASTSDASRAARVPRAFLAGSRAPDEAWRPLCGTRAGSRHKRRWPPRQ